MHCAAAGAASAADAPPVATHATTRIPDAVRRAAVVFMSDEESRRAAILPVPLPLDGVALRQPRPPPARPRRALAAVRAADDDAKHVLRGRGRREQRTLTNVATLEAHDVVAL